MHSSGFYRLYSSKINSNYDRATEEKMRIALLILGSLISTCTYAQIYKCTDANGKTNYQSKPCAPEDKTVQINLKTGGTVDVPDQEKQNKVLAQQALDEKIEQELVLKKEAQLKQDALIESAKNQFLIKNNPDKYSAFSIPPYDYEHLPELIKAFRNRLPDIERLRKVAAEKALATASCTRVEASELHSKSTKKA